MRSLYKGILIAIVFSIGAFTVSAQQNSVAIGTSTANQNAVLLLVGNGKQGLILPTTTDQTQISTSASETGMIVFNTQLKQVFFYDGSAWNAIGTGSGGSYSLTYSAATKVITLVSGTSGTPTIDISTTALTGDLGSTLGSPKVTRIQGSSVTATAPTTLNQALIWDTGTNTWTPTSISGDITPLTLGKFNVTGLLGSKLPLLSAAVAASTTNYLVYDAVGSKWNWNSGASGGITSVANGGTGLSTTPTSGQLLIGNGAGYTLRTLLSSDIPNLSATQITSGVLPLANGGTSLSTIPAANQVLTTNATGTVLWGSITGSHLSAAGINYPATFTANNFATAGTLTAGTGNITTLNLSGALGVGSTPNYGTAGQVLTSAGAGVPPTWSSAGGAGWSLTGNAGTSASTNFIGTTDAQSLVFKTGGTEWARLTTAGNFGIGTTNPSTLLNVQWSPTNNINPAATIQASGANSAAALRFMNSSGQNYNMGISSLGEFIISSVNNNVTIADIIRINSSGKLGINQSAPTEVLDVAGNVKFSGAIMPNNLPGTSGQVLTSAGAGASPTWTTISGGGNMISTNNLSDVASVAAARTNLGLGSMALVANPLTTNGDMIYGVAATPTRLAVGTNGQVLTISGGLPSWQAAGGFANPMTTAGDIIYGGAAGAPTRLSTGTGFLRGGAIPSYSAINLASADVTGTLPIANGGTGATTPAAALTSLGALGTTLNSAKIFVGSAGNVATAQTLSGDATITNAGALTIANSAIVDAKVSATAAIAGTKISPNFGAQNVVTTGTLSSGATTVTGLTVSGATTTLNAKTYTWPAAITAGVLTTDASGNLSWVVGGGSWNLTGNAGTSAATNFIGTTDANDLVFKTNNTEYARLSSAGKFGIGNSAPSATLDVINNSTSQGILVSKNGASGPGLQVIASGGAEAININQNGGGYGLDVIVTNASNSNSAIVASHSGPGSVINANSTGTGSVASLSIVNSASTATALTVSTNGAGPSATFTGGNVGIGVTAPTAKLQVENGTNTPGAGNGNVEIFTGNGIGSALFANFSTNGDGTGTVYSQGSISGYETNAMGPTNFGLWGHQFGNGSGGWGVVASNGASTTSPVTYAGLAGVSYSGVFMGGNVGIGTTTPAASNQLDVQSSYSGGGNAINAQNNSTGNALYAYASNGGHAVWGYSPSGIAVEGQSATSNGVYGFSTSGAGVFGSTTSGYAGIFLGGNVGIGTSTPAGSLEVAKTDWNVTPVIFNSTNTSAGSTLRFINPATGNHTYDIIGSTGSGAALAIGSFGIWDNTSSAYRFSIGPTGAVSIPGTLSKGSGTFKIDHPVDPENKFLYHSFVESPDMMNVYNGNITTDEKGNAIVHLPDYFESLNKDFRYQLTVIGEFAQAIVGKKIQQNQFMIKTDKPNIEVSWQVTGVRKDPFAEKNRVVPEVLKSPEEKGKYLHPDAYGMPPEKGIGNKTNQ